MYKKIYRHMCFLSILTLFFTTTVFLCGINTLYKNKAKKDIEQKALLISQALDASKYSEELLNLVSNTDNELRFEILGSNGSLLYTSKKQNHMTQNQQSINKTALSSEDCMEVSEYISPIGNGKEYCKTVRLSNSCILRVFAPMHTYSAEFRSIIVVILIFAVLIYILAGIIASKLTRSIVMPIKNYSFDENNSQDIYEEIKPLLERINTQHDEIKRQMKKIQSQKFRLRTITDNIDEGLIVLDKKARILSLNDFTEKLFEVKDYKKKNLTDITNNKTLTVVAREALNGSKSNVTCVLSNKMYHIFASPVYNNDEINGVVILLFDISTKSDSEHMRREFTANVSHELKTPLTSIHGYAQIITSGIAKPEDIKGFAEKIEKESSRLIVLIDDIIKLSKLDENIISIEKQKVYFKAVIFDVCEMLKSNAEEKNVKITVSGDDFCIFANESQMTELCYNLVDNAIKYNKINGTVEIELSDHCLRISDSGIGIESKYFERIFERFYRVDKSHSKKVNGTGLGLSIVKHIARANNANIDVKSVPGQGTEFTVIFNQDETES